MSAYVACLPEDPILSCTILKRVEYLEVRVYAERVGEEGVPAAERAWRVSRGENSQMQLISRSLEVFQVCFGIRSW